MSMKSDVMIVLARGANAFEILGEICGRDGVVHSYDGDMGVLEATLAAEHVGPLAAVKGVAYVRPVMTFAHAA
jgi:hypothetical protein